jgi:serine/threonine protein kinase
MEFVEGETLEHLIRGSGWLEVKLALEIVSQVAAGLAAVHEQNLVHRDIKPGNIMVRLKDDGSSRQKLSISAWPKRSLNQIFKPRFRRQEVLSEHQHLLVPNNVAGLALDTRSDLYSLGVTLWEMLTGRTPFRGTPGEVMYQHQHTPLPLEQLEGVPQPVVVLIEMLLEKDLARRFQNPTELLKAIPTITGAIDGRRRVTRQSLQKAPSTASRVELASRQRNLHRRRFP